MVMDVLLWLVVFDAGSVATAGDIPGQNAWRNWRTLILGASKISGGRSAGRIGSWVAHAAP